MRLDTVIVNLALCLPAIAAGSDLELLRDAQPQQVFSGEACTVKVVLQNSAGLMLDTVLRRRIYQASSTTAAPLEDAPWKRVQVLPGQTVIESAVLSFPAVRAETRFVVQWLEGARVLGVTDILVYPPDLLRELKCLAGGKPLGIFDPLNEIKPLLDTLALDYVDLEDTGLGAFTGRLAILGPFRSRLHMREGFEDRVRSLARKGTAVVWIQPSSEQHYPLKPSFYLVPLGKGTVVVVQAELVRDPGKSPQAQLNLVQLCQLAIHPEPMELPHYASPS